jgi:hypothetical protein
VSCRSIDRLDQVAPRRDHLEQQSSGTDSDSDEGETGGESSREHVGLTHSGVSSGDTVDSCTESACQRGRSEVILNRTSPTYAAEVALPATLPAPLVTPPATLAAPLVTVEPAPPTAEVAPEATDWAPEATVPATLVAPEAIDPPTLVAPEAMEPPTLVAPEAIDPPTLVAAPATDPPKDCDE